MKAKLIKTRQNIFCASMLLKLNLISKVSEEVIKQSSEFKIMENNDNNI
jgi:hypothetical protein